MARPGRKRKQGVKRHPGGKIVQKPKDERDVAISARMRVYGMTKARAKTQESGNALSYPMAEGKITQSQYDAAFVYAQARSSYHKAILSLRMRSGSDFGGVGGHDNSDGTDDAYVKRCQRDTESYKILRRAVLQSGSLSLMALESWIDYSDITRPLPYACLGDFKLAANAIHRIIHKRKKAA